MTGEPRNGAPSLRWRRWYVGGLLLVGLVVVLRLGGNPGFYNVDELVLCDASARSAWFSWQYLLPGASPFYRPVGFMAFQLQLGLCGCEPTIAHGVSVLHHLLNLALLGLMWRRLRLPPSAAMLAMVLPICLPGVAWVAAVYDRLALSWMLLAALAMTVRGAASLWAIPAVVLALSTKETAAAFVVAAWLLWWWRGASRDRAVAVAVVCITALVVGFVVWRALAAQQVSEYRLAIDAKVPNRLARYLAFTFALGAEDPRAIRGFTWLGLAGASVWLAAGVRAAPRLAIAGFLVWLAPLGMIALLPKIEGHYLYLGVPGFALITAAALRSRLPLVVLVLTPLALGHGWQVGTSYLRQGRALQSLAAVHAALPPVQDPVDVIVTGGGELGAATRFAAYLDQVGRKPRVRVVPAPTTGVWLEMVAEGGVVLRSR